MSNFNFTFQSGISSQQVAGFEVAGRIWSQYLDEDAVFNVSVAATTELPSSVVGGALPVYVPTDIATVQAALSQDATSDNDFTAVSNLNTASDSSGATQYRALINGKQYQSSDLTITQANAKVLGLDPLTSPDSPDGYVIFNILNNSDYEWNYDFSRASTVSNQQLDFLGMALHELGHIMGFVSGIDSMDDAATQTNQPPPRQFSLLGLGRRLFGLNNRNTGFGVKPTVDLSQTSVFDLFRYSERSTDVNAQELTQGEEAYFSIDGGRTSLASLSPGSVKDSKEETNYQASHWGYESSPSFTQSLGFPSLFDFITNPFRSAFDLADAVLSLPSNLLRGQFSTIAQNAWQQRSSLGIMDPALIPGKQSSISELDLQALDVIGYDLSETIYPFTYDTILQDNLDSLVQTLSENSNEIISRASFVLENQQTAIFDDFDDFDEDELLERRRSRVRTRTAIFFQEIESQTSVEQRPSFLNANALFSSAATPDLAFGGSGVAADGVPLGKATDVDELLSGGISSSRSQESLHQEQQSSGLSTMMQDSFSSSSSEDLSYLENRPFKDALEVLFGVSDSYVSGRSGTGSWLFNQSPIPLFFDLEGVI